MSRRIARMSAPLFALALALATGPAADAQLFRGRAPGRGLFGRCAAPAAYVYNPCAPQPMYYAGYGYAPCACAACMPVAFCPPIPPGGGAAPNPGPGPAAQEAARVHCIFILASADPRLGPQVEAGGKQIVALFDAPRLSQKVATRVTLRGREATAEGIRKACNDLKTTADDSIFVFYGGHGATESEVGHVLLPQALPQPGGEPSSVGAKLPRSELSDLVGKKPHKFICMVTDACSSKIEISRPVGAPTATAPATEEKAIVTVMLNNKGFLDINASTYDKEENKGELAVYTPAGGVMTLAFLDLAGGPKSAVDADRNGVVLWKKELLPKLKERTEERYQVVKAEVDKGTIDLAEIANQPHQRVQEYDHD